jgi:type IV pilus assembly protein PilY1
MMRALSRTVVAPPPEPVTAIQVSKTTGQVRYSALSVEPGGTSSVNITTGQDPMQLVSQLPLSRSLHNCRHTDDGGCFPSP